VDIGTFGIILIIISWIPELKKTIISKKIGGLDIKFVLLYFLGSLMLFIHAINIKDMIFMILNGMLSLMALAQLFILLKRDKR